MSVEANPTVSDPNPNNLEDVVVVLDEPTKPGPAEVETPIVDDGTAYEYNPTGDVGLDMALQFVGKAGIPETHPAMVAAQKGDFSLLKATLAAKGAAGWEQFVALGEQAWNKNAEKTKATAAAVKAMVVQAAGGEAEWTAVQKWASANASPEEKAEVNALLNKGGVSARGAVKYLMDAYAKAGNVTVTPADPTLNAGRGGKPEGANAPLSPTQYAEAVRDLNVKLRGRIDDSPEYARLKARRQAFKG